MKDFILTYDLGTTGNKCTLFDHQGTSLASVTLPYGTDYPRPGWAQQDPEQYWHSAVQGTRWLRREFPGLTDKVGCIGLSGHMNGMLPVDRQGRPLFPEIIHSDGRSASFCPAIRQRIGDREFYDITGNRIDSHLSLPKILWFRETHPSLYKRTAWFLQSKDFLAGRLTGCYGFTDYSDASLTCVLDLKKKAWSGVILEETGLRKEMFPELLPSHRAVGPLRAEAAALLELKEGIPVYAGGGDAACSARGAGIGDYTTAQNYIGSSSWISVLSPEPMEDPRRRVQNFFDLDGESINVCGTVQCAGAALDWMIREIAGIPDPSPRDYRAVEEMAAQSPPGAAGLFFLPYLMGERTPHWNPALKGGFVGLSLGHRKKDLIRSVFEGIAFALKDVLSVFEERGRRIDELSLTGGGALSPFWNGMMSAVYGKPVKIPGAPKQATSLGAAMAAGVGEGVYDSYAAAVKIVGFSGKTGPDRHAAETYSRGFDTFRELYAPYAEIAAGLAARQTLDKGG